MGGFALGYTFKKRVFGLIAVAAAFICLFGFSKKARAANYSVTFDNSSLYHITNESDVVYPIWMHNVPEYTDFKFKVQLASGVNASLMEVMLKYGNTSTHLIATNNVYTIPAPIGGAATQYIVTINLYNKVDLANLRTHATNQTMNIQAIDVVQGYNEDRVPYNGSFSFVLTSDVLKLPKVEVNGTGSILGHQSVSIYVAPAQYKYTYYIPNVKQDMILTVDSSVDAYPVSFPEKDDEKYVTTPNDARYYIVEKNQDFVFDFRFTDRYIGNDPHVSHNGVPDVALPEVQDTSGGLKASYKITIRNIVKPIDISFNKAQWAILKCTVQVVRNVDKFGLDPETQLVSYGAAAVFYLSPTAGYLHNTTAPIINADGGHSGSAIREGTRWKCTIPNVTKNITVTIDISSWTYDINSSANSVVVTLPAGTGYSIANIAGGTGLGKNQYQVVKGNDFMFSVNVNTGYDSATLVVKAGSATLTPVNSIYTISNLQASTQVSITISAVKTPTPTPAATGGNNADDGTLKFYELTDTKSGITVSGFFVGKPTLIITDLSSTDKVYSRLLTSSGRPETAVLRAVDIAVTGATHYGNLTVGIGVGNGYNTTKVRVVHGTNTADEIYNVYASNGKANVVVSALSPYMVVDPDGMAQGGTGSAGGGSTDSGESGNVTYQPPRTDDVRNIFGYVLVGIVVVGVAFIIWYRNRK
ncbi:MAG: hypothetical protein LBS18_04125 [Clostridiales bacterium]|jgi:hypothetical protein|nr:hypothetical protein [Clostridiales bacterium]